MAAARDELPIPGGGEWVCAVSDDGSWKLDGSPFASAVYRYAERSPQAVASELERLLRERGWGFDRHANGWSALPQIDFDLPQWRVSYLVGEHAPITDGACTVVASPGSATHLHVAVKPD